MIAANERSILFKLKVEEDAKAKEVFQSFAKRGQRAQEDLTKQSEANGARRAKVEETIAGKSIAEWTRVSREYEKSLRDRERAEMRYWSGVSRQMDKAIAEQRRYQSEVSKQLKAGGPSLSGLERAVQLDSAASLKERENALRLIESSQMRAVMGQRMLREGFERSTEGVLKLGRGFAMIGLVGEEDMRKVLDVLLRVQAAIDLTRGGIDLYRGLTAMVRGYTTAVTAATAAEAALGLARSRSAAAGALGGAGSGGGIAGALAGVGGAGAVGKIGGVGAAGGAIGTTAAIAAALAAVGAAGASIHDASRGSPAGGFNDVTAGMMNEFGYKVESIIQKSLMGLGITPKGSFETREEHLAGVQSRGQQRVEQFRMREQGVKESREEAQRLLAMEDKRLEKAREYNKLVVGGLQEQVAIYRTLEDSARATAAAAIGNYESDVARFGAANPFERNAVKRAATKLNAGQDLNRREIEALQGYNEYAAQLAQQQQRLGLQAGAGGLFKQGEARVEQAEEGLANAQAMGIGIGQRAAAAVADNKAFETAVEAALDPLTKALTTGMTQAVADAATKAANQAVQDMKRLLREREAARQPGVR